MRRALVGLVGLCAAGVVGLTLYGLACTTVAAGEAHTPGTKPGIGPGPIDAHFEARWRAAKLTPTPAADDASFLRRVTLDLIGTLPSVDEVEAYLADRRPRKATRTIEALLADPRHAAHVARWASDRWIGALDELPQARPYLEGFRAWIAEAVHEDRSWAQLAQRLIAAEGTTDREVALLYAVRHGRTDPEEFAGAVARDFMGLSLECARCHDHPFEDWKQSEFHGLAAAFARTRLRPVRQGVLRVTEAPLGQHRFADPKGRSFAAPVRYPGAPAAAPVPAPPASQPSQPTSRPGLGGTTATSRRAALARWLVAPNNPWFARNVVNLTWERFFGQPLVTDGIAAASESPQRALLDRLAQGFVGSGFSLRSLERAIVTSRPYRLASHGQGKASKGAKAALEAARAEFAASALRPLSAPVLVDALLAAGGRATPRPGELPRFHARLRTRLIGELLRVLPERAEAGAITPAEALWWLNGQAANGLTRGLGLQAALAKRTPAARVRHLFLRTLSRPPRSAERLAALRYLKSGSAAAGEDAYADLFWALVATTEFASNH